MTVNWNTCAFADEGCTCGRPSLAMVEQTELEQLRTELAKAAEQNTALTALLAQSRTNAATYATEVGRLVAENARVRQQRDELKPVVEAAKVWRFSGNTAGEHREAIAALNAAVDALAKAEATR